MLETIRKSNPKLFYAKFSNNKKKVTSMPNIDSFFDHFKNLAEYTQEIPENTQINNNDDAEDENNRTFDYLNNEITLDEIEKAIGRLKREKSPGFDNSLNEYFIEFKEYLNPIIHKLMNAMFTKGYFPKCISNALIVPVYKKGSPSEVVNYRGISLLSHFGKLFTSILNNRLVMWSENETILSDAQFGFRPKLGTVDAIFAFSSIVTKFLGRKSKLYSCFIDYKQAFDRVDRVKLWRKVAKLGLAGNILNVIQSLYKHIKSSVLLDGQYSTFFANNSGVLQGEIISPILFSLYVNDCESEFLKSNLTPTELQELSLFLLMYADDMVIFSDSVQGLQNMLNELLQYTKKWSPTVNVAKTKVMVFRYNNIDVTDKWYFDGDELEVVNEFTYLGIRLNYNGTFNVAQKQLSLQCRKAMFALRRKCMHMDLNYVTLLSLFDTYVTSIGNYSCEVWGFHSAPDIERVHTDFCKNMLGVKRSTNNNMVYCELGRYPLQISRKIRITKYWLKLLNSNNRILIAAYGFLYAQCQIRQNKKNWVSNVKDMLSQLGLYDIFVTLNNLRYSNQFNKEAKGVLSLVRQRLQDAFLQHVFSSFESSNKCLLYKHIVDHITVQNYLKKPLPLLSKKLICKLRLSAHTLLIETGRYRGIPRDQRICPLCNSDVEDEFHFFVKCKFYSSLRKKYLKPYYYRNPSVFKIVQLLSSQNTKELCNLAVFIKKAFAVRSLILQG